MQRETGPGPPCVGSVKGSHDEGNDLVRAGSIPAPRAKLYALVRSDLAPGAQAVQAAHALRLYQAAFPAEEAAWWAQSNHLVILAAPGLLEWIETLLTGLASTLLFISHDRSFINNVATRIIELDRGKLSSWPGNFDAYMQGKVRASAVEDRHNSAFDKKTGQ